MTAHWQDAVLAKGVDVRLNLLACATALLVGVFLGRSVAEEDRAPTTPGERLRALRADDGWDRLRERASAVGKLTVGFRPGWKRLIREEFGIILPPWKGNKVLIGGGGQFLHRRGDGGELTAMDRKSGERVRVSDREFDCYVEVGGKLRHALPEKPGEGIWAQIYAFLPDRIIVIRPDGLVVICPRRPVDAARPG